MGGLYGAPRILQCIAVENVVPHLKFLGHGVREYVAYINRISLLNRDNQKSEQLLNCKKKIKKINSDYLYLYAIMHKNKYTLLHAFHLSPHPLVRQFSLLFFFCINLNR